MLEKKLGKCQTKFVYNSWSMASWRVYRAREILAYIWKENQLGKLSTQFVRSTRYCSSAVLYACLKKFAWTHTRSTHSLFIQLKETHKTKNSHQAQRFIKTFTLYSLTHASFARKSSKQLTLRYIFVWRKKYSEKICSDKTMGITRCQSSWNSPESAISLSFIRQNQKVPNFIIFLASWENDQKRTITMKNDYCGPRLGPKKIMCVVKRWLVCSASWQWKKPPGYEIGQNCWKWQILVSARTCQRGLNGETRENRVYRPRYSIIF